MVMHLCFVPGYLSFHLVCFPSHIKICVCVCFYPHLRTFFSLLLEREAGKEKGRCERGASMGGPSYMPRPGITETRTEGRTHNLGICLDWELNPQPFGFRTTLQPTEPHQPGQKPGHVFNFPAEDSPRQPFAVWALH